MGSNPQTKNYRQLVTAERRRYRSFPGMSSLIGCPALKPYTHTYKQTRKTDLVVFIYLCGYICPYTST